MQLASSNSPSSVAKEEKIQEISRNYYGVVFKF